MTLRIPALIQALWLNLALAVLLIVVLGRFSPAWADGLIIEVFTDSRHFATPILPRGLAVNLSTFDLSAPDRLSESLSAGLPNDPVAAEALAAQRINANPALENQLKGAWQGHGLALDYGITRVPAWVFNGEAVVYGNVPLTEALGHYQRWQQGKTP